MRCLHQRSGACASCGAHLDAVERLATQLDQVAGAQQPHLEAWEAPPAAVRATQPFGLFAYERVALVVTAFVSLLVLVESLPPWAVLLLLLTTMACLFRTQGRQLDALQRVVTGFVKGRADRAS